MQFTIDSKLHYSYVIVACPDQEKVRGKERFSFTACPLTYIFHEPGECFEALSIGKDTPFIFFVD